MLCRVVRQGLLLLVVMIAAASDAYALSCTVNGASGNYGTVDVLAGNPVTTASSFTVSCTGGTANGTAGLCVQMGQGTVNSNSSTRYLGLGGAGTNTMVHELYSDAALTQVWGAWGYNNVAAYATAGVTFNLSLGPTGSGSHTFNLYGRVNGAQQTSLPGSYSWTSATPAVSYQSGTTTCSSAPAASSNAGTGATVWTATVNANCKISVTTMNFGSSPSIIASNLDSTATISAQCTNTTPYSISLDNGVNASGTQRRLRLGATTGYLTYGLYTDAARSNGWTSSTATNSCSGGANTCSLGTGTGSNQNVTIYGRIPSQTAPASGTFADTVLVTITF